MAEESALNKDSVRLVLKEETILIATSFSISQSILRQPAEFNIRLGRGTTNTDERKGPTIPELIAKTPPNTPFKLYINDNLRMSGRTDGFRATAAGGAASELMIFGRDALAPLHDAHIHKEESFKDATYKSLVETVLKKIGIHEKVHTQSSDIMANRKIQAGVPIRELLPVRTAQEILDNVLPGGKQQTTAEQSGRSMQVKAGERWMDFLRKQLDRAGLFLWAAADGKIILSAPQVNQSSIYKIVRQRGQNRNAVNVIHADYMIDTRPRFTSAIIYGRGGGKKNGRVKVNSGLVEDLEMSQYGYDISRAYVYRDAHTQSPSQAAYFAQRKLAEARRQGNQLVYQMSGLSTESMDGSKTRPVWTPDTMVRIVDDEFGLDTDFWIESVDFGRMPQTTTTIRLMRPYDLETGAPPSGTGVKTGFPKTPNPMDAAALLRSKSK